MDKLSTKQKAALNWIKAYVTIPPVEPRTWKSLIQRGIVTYHNDGTLTVNGADS